MATVPTPYDFAAGVTASASALDLGIRDPLTFLMDPPRVHAYDNSAFSIPSATATLIPFNAEVYDTDSMHNPVTNNSRITFTTAGTYDIDSLFSITPATYSVLSLNVRLNAAGSSSGGSDLRSQSHSPEMTNVMLRFQRIFAAGDYIEFFITQNRGGAASSLSSATLGTRCFARWVSIA